MKPILIVYFCLSAFVSNAQFQTPALKFKFNDDIFKKENFSPSLNFTPSPRQGTLIGTNSFGKVYSLPKDKMPCLVPNISRIITMPNARKYFDNSLMLNPYKIEEIIPQQ